MEEKSRNSGVDAVGKIRCGTHFCQLYQTEQDLMDIVIPYTAAGLENNEFCIWILPDILVMEEAKKALKKIPNIDTYFEKRQIEIISFSDFHLKEELLKSKGALNFWNKKLEQALNSGYSGLRVVENNNFQEKNSSCVEKESWNDLLDYEQNLNFFVNEDKKHKILFLCTYELGLCSPVEIIELSKIHHFVLAKKQEKWKLLETSIQRNRAERFQTEEKLEGKKLEEEKIEPEKGCQNIKELHNPEKEIHNGYKEIQAQSEKLQEFKEFNE
ncbi:MAG: MEDS domain-containing protein [Methanosarcina sp.]